MNPAPLKPWQIIGGIALAMLAAAWMIVPLFFIKGM